MFESCFFNRSFISVTVFVYLGSSARFFNSWGSACSSKSTAPPCLHSIRCNASVRANGLSERLSHLGHGKRGMIPGGAWVLEQRHRCRLIPAVGQAAELDQRRIEIDKLDSALARLAIARQFRRGNDQRDARPLRTVNCASTAALLAEVIAVIAEKTMTVLSRNSSLSSASSMRPTWASTNEMQA